MVELFGSRLLLDAQWGGKPGKKYPIIKSKQWRKMRAVDDSNYLLRAKRVRIRIRIFLDRASLVL